MEQALNSKVKIMPSAIILLNTAMGKEKDTLKLLRNNESVEEAFAVQSVYDIVAKVKAESFDRLREIVNGLHHSLPKNPRIETMLIVDGSS